MKILVINGPNINMLGIREPEIYGSLTYDDLVEYIKVQRGDKHEIRFFQSNHEGEIIDKIQDAYFKKFEGIVINPAGYTHTSVAIADALKSIPVPAVEVHISNPATREEYRHISYVKDAVIGTFAGLGFSGYIRALDCLESYRINNRNRV